MPLKDLQVGKIGFETTKLLANNTNSDATKSLFYIKEQVPAILKDIISCLKIFFYIIPFQFQCDMNCGGILQDLVSTRWVTVTTIAMAFVSLQLLEAMMVIWLLQRKECKARKEENDMDI